MEVLSYTLAVDLERGKVKAERYFMVPFTGTTEGGLLKLSLNPSMNPKGLNTVFNRFVKYIKVCMNSKSTACCPSTCTFNCFLFKSLLWKCLQ